MKKLEQILFDNIYVSILFGVYDVLQAAAAPISTSRIVNKIEFDEIPEGLTPKEAIAWFNQKEIIASDIFAKAESIAKAKSFSIATAQDLLVIKKVKFSLDKALEKGLSFGSWKKDIANTLPDRMGITFKSRHHIETVFRTNMQTSYNSGRFIQTEEMKTVRPFLEYNAVDDSRVRDEHAAIDGIVKPVDDPFWDEFYPPNGFNCRCVVTSLSKFEVDRDNIDLDKEVPKTVLDPAGNEKIVKADKGFDVNSAKAFIES